MTKRQNSRYAANGERLINTTGGNMNHVKMMKRCERIGEELGRLWAKAAPRSRVQRLTAARFRAGEKGLRTGTVVRLTRLRGFDLATLMSSGADTYIDRQLAEGFAFGAADQHLLG